MNPCKTEHFFEHNTRGFTFQTKDKIVDIWWYMEYILMKYHLSRSSILDDTGVMARNTSFKYLYPHL